MALHLSDLYHASSTEKVLDMEKDLKQELEELKQEIDENDTVLEMPSKAVRYVEEKL
jgi:cell division septum initiation protein DivIVA